MSKSKALENHSAFTLVELLIVIAIIAILSVVVIMAINPVEMLRKARDSNRSTDLNVLNKALSIYNTDQPSGSLGSPTTVYVSLPDSSATCGNLGLPSLPSGYTYACATTANLRKTNGTGWVPVNLASISFGTPLATLPIDPVNTTSTGLYYTYIPGGSWELTSTPESSTYKLGGTKDKVSTDGGDNPSQMEVGSNLALLPIEYGDTSLVGYWKFDEGSGIAAYDASGKGNTGTLVSGPSYVTGKIGNALSFHGAIDYVNIPYQPTFRNAVTVAIWIKRTTAYNQAQDVMFLSPLSAWYFYDSYNSGNIHGDVYIDGVRKGAVDVPVPYDGNWYYMVYTYDSATHLSNMYKNGVLASSVEITGLSNYLIDLATGNLVYMGPNSMGRGIILDDARIYNRALSAAEISAIYNATK